MYKFVSNNYLYAKKSATFHANKKTLCNIWVEKKDSQL